MSLTKYDVIPIDKKIFWHATFDYDAYSLHPQT